MQDLPPAADLLDAIADLLSGRVLPDVGDPVLRHEVRVAASLCRILARETLLDEAMDARQRGALTEVVGEGRSVADAEARLAEAVTRGRRVDAELLDALRVLVGGKLEVARPGYGS